MSANPAPSARRVVPFRARLVGVDARQSAAARRRRGHHRPRGCRRHVGEGRGPRHRRRGAAGAAVRGRANGRSGECRAHAVVSLRHHRDGLGAGPAGHDHRAEGRERRRPGLRRAPARRRRGRRWDRRATARAGADRDRGRRRAARRDRPRLGAAGLADPRLRGPVGVARSRCGRARRARLVALDPGRHPRRRAHARRSAAIDGPYLGIKVRRGLHGGGRARPRHRLRRQVGDPPRAGRGRCRTRASHRPTRRSSTRAP